MHTQSYPTAYRTKMGSPCLTGLHTQKEENCVSVVATAVTQQ